VTKRYSYFFLLLIAQLFWAGNFVIGRAMHADIPPFTLAFYRWLLVSILLFLVNYKSLIRYQSEIKNNLLRIIIWSTLSIVIYTPFIYLGLHSTSVLSGSLTTAIIPVLIVIFSAILLRYSLTVKVMTGIVLSLLGVFLILTRGHIGTIIGIHYNIGDAIIFIAAIVWALAAVLYKKFSIPLPPTVFLLVTAMIGTVMLFPCFLAEHALGHVMHYSWLTVSSILYIVIFPSILAFTFWNTGISHVGPATAGYFLNLLPVFSSLLAIIFLGETVHLYHITGFCLVVIGIILSTVQVRRRKNEAPTEIVR